MNTELSDGPYLCRLEYLTRDGWQTGHKAIMLLHPDKYVERLTDKGKVGRVTILDTGQVIVSPDVPDPSRMVASDTQIPQMLCPHCDAAHRPPFDGKCLL